MWHGLTSMNDGKQVSTDSESVLLWDVNNCSRVMHLACLYASCMYRFGFGKRVYCMMLVRGRSSAHT